MRKHQLMTARVFPADRQSAPTLALAGGHSNIFRRGLYPQFIGDDFALSEYQRSWKLALFLRHHPYDYVYDFIYY